VAHASHLTCTPGNPAHRRLILGREIVTESLLDAIAAYLLIGMFFAFACKSASEFGNVPFFGSAEV